MSEQTYSLLTSYAISRGRLLGTVSYILENDDLSIDFIRRILADALKESNDMIPKPKELSDDTP